MPTLRICGVQMQVSAKLDDNLEKILTHIRTCGSDFILFPEMSLTGYHGDFGDKAARNAWRLIAAACRQSYVTAFIGTGCRENGSTFIQTRIYTDQGELLGTHEKIVPTSGDRKFCQPGGELRVFEHKGLVFGCLICNDMWVTPGCGPYPDPRLAYQLGQKGARAVFHAINSGSSTVHTPYHESNLALRAMESRFHVFTANAADPSGPVNATTGVMTPSGEWGAHCPRTGEHTYSFDYTVEPD